MSFIDPNRANFNEANRLMSLLNPDDFYREMEALSQRADVRCAIARCPSGMKKTLRFSNESDIKRLDGYDDSRFPHLTLRCVITTLNGEDHVHIQSGKDKMYIVFS